MSAIVKPRTSFVTTPRATLAPRQPPEPGAERGAPAVDVRGFNFWYGERQVLRNLEFTIERKAVTAIIGPSGCGKSTFLRSINRLNDLITATKHAGRHPGGGSLGLRARHRPRGPAPAGRHGLPAPEPVPQVDVRQRRLRAGAQPAGCAARPARSGGALLRQAALWDEVKDRLEEPATGLSGGQQQRLCIARALGNQPEVLLMDEPCSALDPIATQRVEELIFELKRDYTIVIVTHNMQQAARVSDYTGFFDRGELVEFGETERIFTSPAHERTEAYITGRFG